jgi:hypothetical protein
VSLPCLISLSFVSTRKPVDYNAEHIFASLRDSPKKRRRRHSSSDDDAPSASGSAFSSDDASDEEEDDDNEVDGNASDEDEAKPTKWKRNSSASRRSLTSSNPNPNAISESLADALMTAFERVGYNRWDTMRAQIDRDSLSSHDREVCDRLTDEAFKFFALGVIKQHLLAQPIGVGGEEGGAPIQIRPRHAINFTFLASLPVLRDAETLIGRYQSLRAPELQREQERILLARQQADQLHEKQRVTQVAMQQQFATSHTAQKTAHMLSAVEQMAWQAMNGAPMAHNFMNPFAMSQLAHSQQPATQQWKASTPPNVSAAPTASATPSIQLHACAACGDTSRAQSKCGACNTVVYCSRPCQLSDWRLKHKHECAVRAKDPEIQKAAMEAATRLAAEKEKEKEKSPEDALVDSSANTHSVGTHRCCCRCDSHTDHIPFTCVVDRRGCRSLLGCAHGDCGGLDSCRY